MITLAKTLERFGIETTAAELEQMVSEAVEELVSEWHPLDPRTSFSLAELDELRDGGLTLEPKEYGKEDPVLQTATRYAAVLAASLSVGRLAEILGVDPSRVRHRLAERSLYGIRLRSGWRVPAFQLEGGKLLPGTDLVLPHLPEDMHPLEVVGWFTTPDANLVVDGKPVSPREWLRLGKSPKKLIDLAASLDYEL